MMISALENSIRPLNQYIERPDVSEIIVNQPGEIVLETQKGWDFIKDNHITIDLFKSIGRILANKKDADFDKCPYLGGELPGGHRIHICTGNTVESGIASAIRLKRFRKLEISNFLSDLSFQPRPAMFFDVNKLEESLKRLVLEKRNILISGATSTGKTNLLNILIRFIPETDRFLTMEDVRELDTSHLKNKVHFVLADNGSGIDKNITATNVMDAMMRLRPDRVACGELRIENTWTLLSLLNNGHGGCMTTIHASSPLHALSKVTTNAASASKEMKEDLIDRITRECLDVIIQINVSQGVRYISEIAIRGKDF